MDNIGASKIGHHDRRHIDRANGPRFASWEAMVSPTGITRIPLTVSLPCARNVKSPPRSRGVRVVQPRIDRAAVIVHAHNQLSGR